MNFLQSAILGLVQGLTEFIPVSSTGHLIVARKLMNLDLVGTLSFDAILQLATGLAVLIYFWKDIWHIVKNRNMKLIGTLIVATIPAVILGLFLEDIMDSYFRSSTVIAIALIFGAILFYLAERHNLSRHQNDTLPLTNGRGNVVTFGKGAIVGFFQCLALVPGMSRSGSTISGGLFVGLSREMAIRFSFLLSLPIIFGSGLKKVFDLWQGETLPYLDNSLIVASIFAFISGFLAIHFLLKFLKNHSLNYYGVYRIVFAVIILIWL